MQEAKKISALIVDDEPLVRQGIRDYLSSVADIDVVGEARDGLEALERIDAANPELLFLDVQMPEVDGFEVLRRIGRDPLPVVVFVTAYEKYALQAFAAHAIDYLLKPFDRMRFLAALERAREQVRLLRTGSPAAGGVAGLLGQLQAEPRRVDRFVVKHAGRLLLIPVAEVQWVEAAGNYVHLHTKDGQYLIRETVGKLQEQLDPREFVRIHRSTIVRLSAVKELERLFAGDFLVRLAGGKELTLSRNYRRDFETVLGREL